MKKAMILVVVLALALGGCSRDVQYSAADLERRRHRRQRRRPDRLGRGLPGRALPSAVALECWEDMLTIDMRSLRVDRSKCSWKRVSIFTSYKSHLIYRS